MNMLFLVWDGITSLVPGVEVRQDVAATIQKVADKVITMHDVEYNSVASRQMQRSIVHYLML